jgi:hypothetical protein
MGWLYPHEATRKPILLDIIIRNWNGYGTIHATHSTRNCFWMLVTPPGYEKPIIGLYVIQKAQGLWGYKDMEEAACPYYYDCPLDWLEKAPVTNQNWRDGVVNFHNKKKILSEATKKIVAGKTYKVNGAWKFNGRPLTEIHVISTKPYRGASFGYTVKLSRKLIAALSE